MNWQLADKISQTMIEQWPELNPVILQLLHNRGLTDEAEIKQFLEPDWDRDILDPYLFIDMKQAVARILACQKKKEKICVFGDYDVDGVSGATILSRALRDLELDFFVYIPHRDKEGYGLNDTALDKIAEQGAKVIITVDCGISNFSEITRARQQYNIDVIIVDHHDIPEQLPPAHSIIHGRLPRESYPFKGLSGGGTAFKLAQAILRDKNLGLSEHEIESKEKWLLDLVALSTIGDIMPLVGENRTMVKFGLIVLQKTRSIGLRKLYEGANIEASKIDERVVGWQINPRLNAAGRLRHADMAHQLLFTDNIEQAIMMASALNKSNEERQRLTEQSLKEAMVMAEEQMKKYDKAAIVVAGEQWPPGIVGLVAGRLANKFNRPAFVATRNGERYVGSGRTVGGFNVTDALRDNAELFIKFGGHAAACGFSFAPDKLATWQTQMLDYSQKKLAKIDLTPILSIDAVLTLADCSWDLQEGLSEFEPWGEDNPEPNFLLSSVMVKDWQTVGKEDKHLRLVLQDGDIIKKAIAFGLGEWAKDLKLGSQVDIVFQLGVNEWNGNRELQIKVVDMRISS
ncbi:MAG: single-stranded-DNA-specific exonuclease RecJ [Candidatus Komeilibacteria bacterium]